MPRNNFAFSALNLKRIMVSLLTSFAFIFSFVLAGCGGSSQKTYSALTPSSITLPQGKIGTAYSATFTATGGKTPYSWSVQSGTLPTGLTLNASSGILSGTPSSAVNSNLVIEVADAESTPQTATVDSKLLVTAIVSVASHHAELAAAQPYKLTATTNDPSGVNWSVSGSSCTGSACGSFSSANTLTGVAVTFTAATTAGNYTIKATSAGDQTTNDTNTVTVTDLAGVTTYHYNLERTGVNAQEYALAPSTVSGSHFGKLFSCTVDGAIYAAPLWMPNLSISSATHNVVFVATQHDSLYAFDADSNTSPCTPLWHANLIDSAHGANSGESSVPSSGSGALVGSGYGDIAPEVGVVSTPVIDPTTNTIYVVSKSAIVSGPTFYQRLHAIDMLTGNEKFSGPVEITATYPGTGDGGSTVAFEPRTQNQRAALTLANGNIYLTWASHEDTLPYYGWIISYNASTLAQTGVMNLSPNVQYGGIWMNGDGFAVDASGNLYALNGNATFDATNSSAPKDDYGDSSFRFTPGLALSQYFTPSDQAYENNNDLDFGSGGAVLVDIPSSALPSGSTYPTSLLVGGGKEGYLYVWNRNNLGGYGDTHAVQKLDWGNPIFATPAYWNNTLYFAGVGGNMQAFKFDSTAGQFPSSATSASSVSYGFPGSTPVISVAPSSTAAVLWSLNNTSYCTPQSSSCGPTVLHAFDPNNLATEYWNSSTSSANTAGYAVKFTVPTVANGRVYVGTRGNNIGNADSSTTIPGELDVYGILPY